MQKRNGSGFLLKVKTNKKNLFLKKDEKNLSHFQSIFQYFILLWKYDSAAISFWLTQTQIVNSYWDVRHRCL